MAEPLLKAQGITKSFPGVLALDGVDFELMAGEVHILVGENGAGKSTMIKLLSGVYAKDTGQFFMNGRPVEFDSVQTAQALGISTIYQELNLIPGLTVAQNIFLGREPRKKGLLGFLVDNRRVEEDSARLLESLGLDIPTNTLVSALTVPQQQMVEVAKALSLQAKVFIFDEPTATLAEKESEALFNIIRQLQQRGIGVIYISHRLEEAWCIGNRVSVLRDGRYMGTLNLPGAQMSDLIKMMVGRDIKEKFPRTFQKPGPVALELRGLGRKGVLHEINLKVRRGEIVGLAGLVGSGRTDLARAIFGIDPIDAGEIYLFGERVKIDSSVTAAGLGLAFLTEDRKSLGLFQTLDLCKNISISAMPLLFPRGIVNSAKECALAEEYIEKLQINCTGMNQIVQSLSGGNQQKVVIAKWMATRARFLILDEPTRGVDVGAKLEIHRLIDKLVTQGLPVLMISSEMPEILGMCDRIYVMNEGRITAEYSHGEASQENILRSALCYIPEGELNHVP
jgi:ribose transport system ATP-binding protein